MKGLMVMLITGVLAVGAAGCAAASAYQFTCAQGGLQAPRPPARPRWTWSRSSARRSRSWRPADNRTTIGRRLGAQDVQDGRDGPARADEGRRPEHQGRAGVLHGAVERPPGDRRPRRRAARARRRRALGARARAPGCPTRSHVGRRARSRTAPGHAWEQGCAAAAAARARRALLCPANLAPLAARNVVVVIHDAAPAAPARLVLRRLRGVPARVLPLIARRARARRSPSREFSRDELRELLGVEAAVVYGGVDARFPARRRRRPRARSSSAPYVLCVASHTARKNLARARPGRAGARARGRRARRGRRPPPAVRGRARARRARAARPRRRRAAARRCTPAREAFVLPVALRGLRPAGAGGDGERDAGRGGRPTGAARDRRRRRAPGRAGRREAIRDGAGRTCWATRPSRSACARAGSARARAFTLGAARRARSTRSSGTV